MPTKKPTPKKTTAKKVKRAAPVQTEMELPSDAPISTLRPGYLVSLATNVKCGVNTDRQMIEEEHRTRNGEVVSVAQVTRTVRNPEEYKKANQVRMKVRSLIISGICAKGDFGLICADDKLEKLLLARKEATRIVNAFNDSAQTTHVRFSCFMGRVAQDDVAAVRAIKGEIRGLIAEMSEGIKNCDVKKIRDAAAKTRSVAMTLSPQAAEQAKAAIAAARSAATKAAKAGETAAVEIDREALRKLRVARTAFLDTDDGETSVTAPAQQARAVDFDPDAEPEEEEAETSPVEPVQRAGRSSPKAAGGKALKTGKAPKRAPSRAEAEASA